MYAYERVWNGLRDTVTVVALCPQTATTSAGNTWNLSGTSQWKYPTKVIVKDRGELNQLSSFMYRKVSAIYGTLSVLHVIWLTVKYCV